VYRYVEAFNVKEELADSIVQRSPTVSSTASPPLTIDLQNALHLKMTSSDRQVTAGPPIARESSNIEELERRLVQQARARARRAAVSRISSPLAVFVLAVVLWEAIVRVFDIPAYLFPAPSLVVRTIREQWQLLWSNSIGTLTAISIGFLMALVAGALVAVLTFAWKPFERGVYPLISAAQAVPKIALAPLLAIWFGFGLATRFLMAFVLAVFAVLVSTLVGLRSITQEKILLARSIGLSPTRTYLKIRLPQALPSMFGGAKVAFTLASVGAIIGEFIGGGHGLGYLIVRANHDFATPLMFAALSLLAAYALLIFWFLEALEKWLLPWHYQKDAAPQVAS
jgi:NitT/TauT family transport system permease protein